MVCRLTVVVSQHPAPRPDQCQLEDQLVAALVKLPGVEIAILPHLYDLKPEGPGVDALQGIQGDLLVLAWLYPRATRWILARHGVHGRPGDTLIAGPTPDAEQTTPAADTARQHVADRWPVPERRIDCLDLRAHAAAAPYVDEVIRIASSSAIRDDSQRAASSVRAPLRIEEPIERRWYPVIDYSRCTNCMECIDFCLFGVYGIDDGEAILVEQPDSCRKGCPACSRVCPENAIMFPQHKTPAIAGASARAADVKIDLSSLFGGEAEGQTAGKGDIPVFAGDGPAEDTRVPKSGMSPFPEAERQPAGTRDELDRLLDALDQSDP